MNIKINKIGALTSKVYSFMGRAQELERIESIDYFNIFGSKIYVEIANLVIIRLLPRLTKIKYSEQITDLIRFSYDSLTIQRILNSQIKIKNIQKVSTYINVYFFLYYLNKFTLSYLYFYKLKYNFIIYISMNEDCDFSFFKKLINLSNFIFLFTYKSINIDLILNLNLFFFQYNSDILFNVNSIQLIGLNLRMDNPLLMNIIYQKSKINNIKIYSIYTVQSSIFNYKSFVFNLEEFNDFLFFKNLQIKNIYENLFLKKKDKINDCLFLINSKLSNFYLYNSINFIFLIDNFFKILNIYLKIIIKFVNENLYTYNYLFLVNNNLLDKLFLKKNLVVFVKNTVDFLDHLYYKSYLTLYFSLNNLNFNYLLNNFFDLSIYIGHHFLFSLINFYKIIVPITFFYEMDSLQYNLYGNLITGKFIFSPTLKIYDNSILIKFLFGKKMINFNINIISYQYFLNKFKYSINFLNLNFFFKYFSLIISNYKNFDINIINFYFFKKISNLNLNADFLNNLSFLKDSNFLQSQNLALYLFNNFKLYLYIF